MMNNEPAYLEIFLTKLAFRFYGKPVYKTFADCIPKGGTGAGFRMRYGNGCVLRCETVAPWTPDLSGHFRALAECLQKYFEGF